MRKRDCAVSFYIYRHTHSLRRYSDGGRTMSTKRNKAASNELLYLENIAPMEINTAGAPSV